MSRRPSTFRQRDVAAAIKAAKAAGCEVARIKVDKDGHITIELVTTGSSKEPAVPLDEWLATHAC
jgi:hypothetical protein